MFLAGAALSPTAPASGGGGGSAPLSPTAGGSGGSGQLAPSSTQTVYSTSVVSYPSGYNYSYQTNVYSLPGAGLSVGPFGDYGPYTPLDFPLLHELRPGERLESLQGGIINQSILPYLVGGLLLYLLLKKR